MDSAQNNLPYTDSSRINMRSGQYLIERDNEQEVGLEALYQLHPGILLRVLDLTIRTAQPVATMSPGKQLLFCFKLAGENTVELAGGERHHTREGSLLFSYCNTPQYAQDSSAAGEKYLAVTLECEPDLLLQAPFELDAEQLPEAIQAALQGVDRVAADFTMNADLIQALQLLLNSDTADRLSRPFLQAKAVEILCLALRNMLQQEGQREHTQISERERQQMDEARKLLQERWQNPPAQEEMVQALGIGKSRLKRCFKWLHGYTITDYLLRIRMQQAQQLLKNGGMSISQVAGEVGYDHPSSFAAAFKRQFGMSPKAFQKNITGHMFSPE